jgi:hypothetical protein
MRGTRKLPPSMDWPVASDGSACGAKRDRGICHGAGSVVHGIDWRMVGVATLPHHPAPRQNRKARLTPARTIPASS